MRSTTDRIRHSIFFELIALVISVPLASWILGKELLKIGVLSIVLSLAAMLINYFFNLLFDHVLLWMRRPLNVRPVWLRVLHALLFELSLLILTVPLVAWWLGMTLLAAFLIDIGFVLFFLVYAFVYNWAYDILFPIPTACTTPVTL